MDDSRRRIAAREAVVFFSMLSIWAVTLFIFRAIVDNPSRLMVFSLNNYFIFLYIFYLVNRASLWFIEKHLIGGDAGKKRIIDSVVISFIIAGALGYFVVAVFVGRRMI